MDSHSEAQDQRYARPPITESVIEFRYAQQLDYAAVEKVCARFVSEYPAVERFIDYNIKIDTNQASAGVTPENQGQKLTNLAGTEVLIVRRSAFAYDSLAPYPGWSEFRKRARHKWNVVKRVIGVMQIARIGLRYVNRLDVPLTTLPDAREGVRLQDYLRMYPESSEDDLPGYNRFFMQVEIPLSNSDYTALINVSSGASLVPQRMSFVLDIDVSRTVNVPQREDKLWGVLDVMRVEKNKVFEACITDAARALFRP